MKKPCSWAAHRKVSFCWTFSTSRLLFSIFFTKNFANHLLDFLLHCLVSYWIYEGVDTAVTESQNLAYTDKRRWNRIWSKKLPYRRQRVQWPAGTEWANQQQDCFQGLVVFSGRSANCVFCGSCFCQRTSAINSLPSRSSRYAVNLVVGANHSANRYGESKNCQAKRVCLIRQTITSPVGFASVCEVVQHGAAPFEQWTAGPEYWMHPARDDEELVAFFGECQMSSVFYWFRKRIVSVHTDDCKSHYGAVHWQAKEDRV